MPHRYDEEPIYYTARPRAGCFPLFAFVCFCLLAGLGALTLLFIVFS